MKGAALLSFAAGLALAPRAFAQCTPTPYIVVDGQTCDWTPSENPLVIPNNDATSDATSVILDISGAEFTDNYNTASTGNGNLYGMMTFASGPGTVNKANEMVGFALNTTGAPVGNNCNANLAVYFICTQKPCSDSANWQGYYAPYTNNNCTSVGTAVALTAGSQYAFATSGNVAEFGVNFAAIPGLGTNFLVSPISGQISGSGNVLGMDTLPQTSYSTTTVGPTAATVSDVAARSGPDGVTLGWLTRTERGNLGFRIFRQRGQDAGPVGGFVRGRLVAFDDQAYRFRDPGGRAGDLYWVGDLDQHSGKLRFHGPVRATPAARLPVQPPPTRLLAAAQSTWTGAHGPGLRTRPGDTARLGVSAEGMVWVPDGALSAAGVTPPAGGALTYGGAPVTSVRDGAGVLFYAGPIQNGYDGVDAYLLGPGRPAGQTAPLRRPGPADPLLATVTSHLHLKQYVSYDWDAAGDDPYIWAWASNLFPPDPVAFDAPAAAATLGGGGTITAHLLGGTEQAHHVQVVLDGAVLGEARWTGLAPFDFTATLPPGLLQPSGNSLTVNALFDTGARLEFVMLESIDLDYDRLPQAVAGEARFTMPPGSCAAVTGLATSARAWEITDPIAAVPLAGLAVEGGTAGLCSPIDGRPHRYELFDFAVAQAPSVRPFAGGDLAARPRVADELVVVHPSLLPALQPLLAARRAQGLRIAVATPEEAADAFAFGDAGPAGIRGLVRHALAAWTVAPRYLLLAGGASADPRDVLGTGVPDLVPTGHTVAGADGMRAASDSWFAAGADGLTPQLSVGRLPADTPAQLAAVVAKILAGDSQSPTGRAALVSDVPLYADDADFAQNSSVVGGRLQAAGIAVTPISSAAAGTEAAIASALAAGTDLWHYVGHAGTSAWGGQTFLTASQVEGLSNARFPILTSFDCLDGMFDDPTTVSVGWAALAAPAGGALAAFVPSTVLSPRQAHVFDLLVVGALTAGPLSSFPRVGDALLLAQQAAAQNPLLADYVRTYNLVGDPASRLPLH